MSFPTEIDWCLIKMGDGATPSETFTLLCGIQDATVNVTANTQDRFVRDCAKPGSIPKRKVKTTGMQMDVTGAGLSNVDTIDEFLAALGKHKNYKIEAYADDGTDAGDLLGTFAGNYVMTAANLNAPRESPASGEITLASDGDWTWTAA